MLDGILAPGHALTAKPRLSIPPTPLEILNGLEHHPKSSAAEPAVGKQGRVRYPRSSIFLNHWLVARTAEEVVAREVFDRFKRFADHDAGVPMTRLVVQVHNASRVYRQFVASASTHAGPVDRLGLFGYRTGVLESEVIKPLVLCLLDPEETPIPEPQFAKALDVLESWMVRRMIVRATTKNYNQVVAELVAQMRKSDRANAGDAIESYLAGQSSGSRYWPDDAEVREELGQREARNRFIGASPNE